MMYQKRNQIRRSVRLGIGISAFVLGVAHIHATESHFDLNSRSVICKESLPVFTLGRNSRPGDDQVKKLCSCIWAEFPEDGADRRTSASLRSGKSPGAEMQPFAQRFGDALKKCGGYSL